MKARSLGKLGHLPTQRRKWLIYAFWYPTRLNEGVILACTRLPGCDSSIDEPNKQVSARPDSMRAPRVCLNMFFFSQRYLCLRAFLQILYI
jgi:hypothetical protein